MALVVVGGAFGQAGLHRRERSANARDVVNRRDHDSNCSRSASESFNDTIGNDGMTPPSRSHTN
jgi:hypothetical protein